MATLIKNTAIYGFFLTEDEDANLLTNNTPGELDLAILVEGADYVKLDRPFNDMEGLKNKWANVWNVKDGKKNYTSYGDQDVLYEIQHVIGESTIALTYAAKEKFKTFWRAHRTKADEKIFIINRIGTDTWEQFPNAAGTLKKYAPIILHDLEFRRAYKNENLIFKVRATVEAIWTS